MLQSSRRRKGKTLQNLVRKKILKNLRHLRDRDVGVADTGQNGPDIILSKTALKLVEHTFECKNQERLETIYDWFDQANKHGKNKCDPVLVIKKNSRKPLAVIDLDHLFELIKE